MEWYEKYTEQLMEDWELAVKHEQLKKSLLWSNGMFAGEEII